MAGVSTINLSLSISGLGLATDSLAIPFTGTVPTGVTKQYRALAATTSEALPLGDIATVEGVLIYAATCDDGTIEVDCDYVDAFNADITMAEGEACYFKPSGVVHVKNADDAAGAYEYLIFGTV